MKKISELTGDMEFPGLKKLFRIMKLTAFLILVSVVCVFASETYAQTKKINLNMKNVTVKEVLSGIEDQSEFHFMYSPKVIDASREVAIDAENSTIEEILKSLFAGTDVEYTVKDRIIVLSTSAVINELFNGQQQKSVSGKVTDSSGGSLPGVSVVVKGTSIGVITDNEGKFALSNVPENATLQFSFVGMKSQEFLVKGKTSIDITLEEETIGIEEVVAIGYGTAKRKDFSGSVSTVKMENSMVALSPNLSALESLKGNVAGLNVGATNAAGGDPSILIRGQNSISGSNTPLIILDGVIYLGSINDINPNDIASYDVLKDAVSSAAYGSRSSNGVIAITTKKGKAQKPTITFNATMSFQKWQNMPEMTKGPQWLDLVNASNSYATGTTSWLKPQQVDNMNAGREINWLDIISRTGAVQNYQVAVSGDANGVNYYLSTSFDENKGVIVGDKFNRISVLGKISTNITKWLQFGADANFTKRDYSGITPNMRAAAMMTPYGTLYRDSLNNYEKYPATQGVPFVNPMWGVDDGTRDNMDVRQNYRLSSYALFTAPWLKGLTFRLNFQNNINQQKTADFLHENYYIAEGDVTNITRYSPATIQNYLAQANGSMNQNSTYSYVLDNILNYNQTFKKHSFDVTLVATRDYSKYELRSMTSSDYSANGNSSLGYWGLAKGTTQKVNQDANERSNIGYLGRVSYSYNEKYFFTGSYRRDGASVFGLDQKWGNFGAAGMAWRISNENFLKDFKPLNNLKLKVSWGQNGNQGVGPYSTLAKVNNGVSSGVRQEFSDTGYKIFYGLVQSNMANSNLGWELTEKFNAGFESVWLQNRLFVDLDVYSSKTTDEIYTPSIPSMNGFSSITSSLGEVHNRGIELTLRTINVKNKDWNWSTSVTYWLNRNKLVHLTGQDLNNDGKEDDQVANGMFIGQPLNSIFGYVMDGIVQSGDVEYKAMPGASTIDGYPKYKDINADGKINADDRKVLGYPQENFRLNMSNTINYKNFDLYIMVSGIFGGGSYYLKSNPVAYMTYVVDGPFANMTSRPYWTTDKPSNVYPSASFHGDGGKFLGLQSRSFVRVQNVSLSYTFKKEMLEKFKFNSLKVFCTATNPMISTKWVGGDPEIGSVLLSSDLPVASTYSFGLNLSF